MLPKLITPSSERGVSHWCLLSSCELVFTLVEKLKQKSASEEFDFVGIQDESNHIMSPLSHVWQ